MHKATSPSQLRALPTDYHGYRFRSRAEARWAVFMETLHVPYEYEPEGFDLGDGVHYLPDFWLPIQRRWLEIKGAEPDPEEMAKAELLAQRSGNDVLILNALFGAPGQPGMGGDPFDAAQHPCSGAYLIRPDGWVDKPYWWAECLWCGYVDLVWEGNDDRLRCGCLNRRGTRYDRTLGIETPRLMAAYYSARGARFGT